jgi:hypothetical protein
VAAKKAAKVQQVQMSPDYRSMDDVVGRYATNLLVQFTQHECTISFFEVKAPVLLGTPEENAAKLKSLGSVPADCVARIVVAIGRVPEFIEALRMAYEGQMNIMMELAAMKPSNGQKKKPTNGETK